MLFQTSLGIDIQEEGIALACLKGSSRDVQLVAHATYPLSQESDETIPEAIIPLVQGFLRDHRISPATVFMGIPRSAVIIRYLDLPMAVKENLRQTLNYEMEKFIPLSADDIYFDHQIISESKENEQITVLLVVVKRETLSPYLKLRSQLGVGISGIEISSTALAEYFLAQDGKNRPPFSAFIYSQKGRVELGVLQNGALAFSRTLSAKEDEANAKERLIYETEKMRQAFEEPDVPLETVLCAAEEDLSFFDPLGETTHMEVHPANLAGAGIPSVGIVPAYGLALKGLRKDRMHINLLPQDLRKKPSRIAHYTMFFLAGLTLLAAMAWGGGTVLKHRWTLDGLNREIDQLSAEIKRIEAIKAKQKSLENRIRYLDRLERGNVPVLDVLKELSVRIPEDAWVKQLDFSEKGITINGEAASASELIPLLEDCPIFKNVAFLSTISKARNGMERFRIGLSLD